MLIFTLIHYSPFNQNQKKNALHKLTYLFEFMWNQLKIIFINLFIKLILLTSFSNPLTQNFVSITFFRRNWPDKFWTDQQFENYFRTQTNPIHIELKVLWNWGNFSPLKTVYVSGENVSSKPLMYHVWFHCDVWFIRNSLHMTLTISHSP